MTLNEELTAAQRCVDDLVRTVTRLERRMGTDALELRRVRTDADHLRESLALLREVSAQGPEKEGPTLVPIPDQPYDHTLWRDADDEGLGAGGRHAP
ncbi:hypothetical protein DMB38_24090 [Streptomyces sp. WAC 06738]|uniref:hypothetical protein n=1 Tax=Streptomyces sp. WAC 06738 TaxID=2203210 RepID=UPI000F702613|nr:hypothetical protein [Streptomyces sp. WAC 06738]AZM48452.1 hypothetical protein DMB38_24090 [Streptomyces sp. WAC 06738]